MYPQITLLIGGEPRNQGSAGEMRLTNPADGTELAVIPKGGRPEAEEAARLALDGFGEWSAVSPFERSKVLRRAADLMRERVEEAARVMVLEQGKPLAEARGEWLGSADLLDWFAEEGRRVYGRIVAGRATNMQINILKKPVGPVAAFTPWNFPAWNTMQKVAPALAAGCAMVVKPSSETPGTAWMMARALLDAGLPKRAFSLIWGATADLSDTLIRAPEIRKVSLTGSTRVGRIVAALAGEHLKKVTMELGGHGPVIVAADADLDRLVPLAVQWKFRNAGQVCVSPTRFIVDERVHDEFVSRMTSGAAALKLGNGLDAGVQMGPLTSKNQMNTVAGMVEDAVAKGAIIETGGARVGNAGNFFAPTVLSGMTPDMLAMNEEPFGPLALVMRSASLDAALEEANRLPVGLGSYLFTRSLSVAHTVQNTIRAGMLGVNHFALALPETPFGGVLDSGFGSEGGTEGLDAYLTTMTVTAAL
ncbi:NAD-dependent succinate-semialdehyde dehydrogenase [Paenirhodobacter populi]|uniref:NAD-dependent succinate-semialdehyde dehydrogenase n=1 Tax=Paenirhodobacter populi TaxID=2306993 RepID=A0A443IR19_9RHOB|nr:NAD-dependent succinate-semialdehyde dehydrogenase [Sinirhodobacter populi]RWR09599.1 NAD-dependent succinate-semialdehyde dehydrogenase [Sinirhodobacter populi]